MNKILKYGLGFVGIIIILLVILQILDSMGIDTCVYDCGGHHGAIGVENRTYVNGKLVSATK
jgi:hypothetical protein